jgi:hypothetical protein
MQVMADIQGDQVEIERNNLPDGLYLFQLSSEGRKITSGKFMVE